MRTCVEGQLTTAGVTDFKKATKAQFDTARKACDAEAKLEFEKAGGKREEFAFAKREGAKDEAGDAMKACVDGKIEDLNLKEGVAATKDQYKTAIKACVADTQANYKKSGGLSRDFAIDQKNAVASKVAESAKACVEGKIEALNLAAGTKPTDAQLKTAKKSCRAEAKAEHL